MKSILASALAVLFMMTGLGGVSGAVAESADKEWQQSTAIGRSITAENIDRALATLASAGFIDSVNTSDDSTGVLPQHDVEILRAAKMVKEATTPEQGRKAAITFSNSLQQSGNRSTVSFVAIRDGKTVHGARIKYRAIGRKLIHAVSQLATTDTPILLPIGIYDFWTEREGVQTSDELTVSVIQKTQIVDLVEHK